MDEEQTINVLPVHVWECSPQLRWKCDTSLIPIGVHVKDLGRPMKLQQLWFCRANMKTEWRDVPEAD